MQVDSVPLAANVKFADDRASDRRMWDPFLPNVKAPEARLQL